MRLKTAWFSPLPPQRSGIADYCEDLLPWIAETMDIDLFVEDPQVHLGTPLARRFPIFGYLDYAGRRRQQGYDVCIYHMGNNLVHRFVYPALVKNPGIVVLHEPMLHHFMLEMLSAGWSREDYSRELDYNYGVDRPDIEAMVEADTTERTRFQYPMLQRVADSALGTIVHSSHAKDVLLRCSPPGPVEVIQQSCFPEPGVPPRSRERARRSLGVPRESFLLGVFGFMTPAKMVYEVIEAFSSLLETCPGARLVLAGGLNPAYPLDRAVSAPGTGGRVTVTGYTEMEELLLWMDACDLGIALRNPSAGETPSSVLRLLGRGCPAVVSDHMAYREFPVEACPRIAPGREREQLPVMLRHLALHPGELQAMSTAALAYAREFHHPSRAAELYRQFALDLLSGRYEEAQPAGRYSLCGEAAGRLEKRVAGAWAGMGLPRGAEGIPSRVRDLIEGMMSR